MNYGITRFASTCFGILDGKCAVVTNGSSKTNPYIHYAWNMRLWCEDSISWLDFGVRVQNGSRSLAHFFLALGLGPWVSPLSRPPRCNQDRRACRWLEACVRFARHKQGLHHTGETLFSILSVSAFSMNVQKWRCQRTTPNKLKQTNIRI